MAQEERPAWRKFLIRHFPDAVSEGFRFGRWYRWKPFLGYLRRAARERQARRAHILFYPEFPNYGSACLWIAHRNGYRVTKDPADRFDVAFHYEHGDQETFEAFQQDLPHLTEAVNRSFVDIRKEKVGRVFEEVFGYPISLDPRTHTGPCVRKSNRNGEHDGTIIQCPIDHIDEDYVYQKTINNEVEDGLVQDIRTPIFRDTIPFVYLKVRPIESRFSNENEFAEMKEVHGVLSEEEVGQILHFCRRMGMDYGELDVLRDKGDGRIYIVDANFTPAARPSGLSDAHAERALSRMAQLFESKFVQGRAAQLSESKSARRRAA